MELILYLIFALVTAIVMFLCFFSLSSSMSANLYEQSKEIAVLRAMGFTKYVITKLYVYEAFVLVGSSSILGVFIGVFVGWSMFLQRMLFLRIPLQFYFPTYNFIVIVITSIICAFASIYAPSRGLLKKSIADIIRFG